MDVQLTGTRTFRDDFTRYFDASVVRAYHEQRNAVGRYLTSHDAPSHADLNDLYALRAQARYYSEVLNGAEQATAVGTNPDRALMEAVRAQIDELTEHLVKGWLDGRSTDPMVNAIAEAEKQGTRRFVDRAGAMLAVEDNRDA